MQASETDPGKRWRDALAAWAVPEQIMAQAPEDPWALPTWLFEPDPEPRVTPSHRRALEALTDGGEVLDVGAGRCAMSLPLRPPARQIIAVDCSPAMLEGSPADITILGRWPDVAEAAGRADVVICGHVLYNVPELRPFVAALSGAARHRVVVEITASHPRNREPERTLWKHFWDIDRPRFPTWQDAQEVIRSTGVDPAVEAWDSDQRGSFRSLEDLVTFMRRTVCLPDSRDPEVRKIVQRFAVEREGRWQMAEEPRRVVTFWWEPA
jgi:SAM-dependent methyltransferase